jgi:predicted ATPase/DNA-binding SARP family transcriptional activator
MLLMMAQVQAFQLSLLGSPRLERGGQAVPIERRKALAVLAFLALTSDCQPRETLATMFWPEAESTEGRAALRRALSVLNTALAGGLDAQRDCVALLPGQVELDVVRFRQHIATARQHHAGGEPLCGSCLAGLAEAAALYRGDFMDAFTLRDSRAFDDWQLQQTESLRGELAECLELLAMGYAHQGDYRSALEPARRWVALDPLHEPAQRLLMKLYAWSGQPTAAIRVYQECARLLEAELGVAPQPETQRLDQTIRAGALTPPVGRPAPVSARLPEQIEGAASRPARVSGPPQLPAPTTPMLGRADELAQIAERLADPNCRLVTIVGPGGSGKTRLALKAAANYGARTGLPVHFVALAGAPEPGLLAAAIGDALGLMFTEHPDDAGLLLDALRDKSLLLLLDNLEHLLPAAGLLADILAQAPGIKLLATSRERLHLYGEWLIELGGLPFPASAAVPNVEFYDAVQLFVQTAQRARADFALEAATRAPVVEICRMVEGMPLGIELAAPWVRLLPAGEIASEITRNVDFLATTRRDVPERHRSLRAAFEHSWQLLDESERQVLRRLSVFRGPFLRAAAEQVAGADLASLAALVDKSLLRALPPRHGLAQYELHHLVRQFGADKLAVEPREASQTQTDYNRYYAQLLGRQLDYVDCGDWSDSLFDEISAEIDNVRVAWHSAVDHGDLDALEKSQEGLFRFYLWQSWYQEGADAFGGLARQMEALSAWAGTSSEQKARCLHLLAMSAGRQGVFCYYLNQVEKSRQLIQRSLALLREHGDPADLAYFLIHSARLARAAGNAAEARHLLLESLSISRAVGNTPETEHALRLLGYLEGEASEFAAATEHFEEAVALGRSRGDSGSLASTLSGYGFVRYLAGDLEPAVAMLREALSLEERAGAGLKVAVVLDNLGYAYAGAGDIAAARAQFARAIEMARERPKLGMFLDIVLGWTATLRQPEEAGEAVALMTFVTEHRAAWLETRDRGTRWLCQRAGQMPAAEFSAAQASGRQLSYEELISKTDWLAAG